MRSLTFALRSLRSAPFAASLIVATIGAGIGAAVLLYAAGHAALLRRPQYRDAARLVTAEDRISVFELQQWRAGQRAFAALGAYEPLMLTVRAGSFEARDEWAAAVTGQIFAALGSPLRLRSGDGVLLSPELASDLFGKPGAALGHTLAVEGRSYRVVGLIPRGFAFPLQPLSLLLLYRGSRPGAALLIPIGRLRSGSTLAQAEAGAARLLPAPTRRRGAIHLRALTGPLSPWARAATVAVGLAALLILLAALTSAASVFLEYTFRRRVWFGVHLALGASPASLRFQVIITAFILSSLGGGVALLLDAAATRAFGAWAALRNTPGWPPLPAPGLVAGLAVAAWASLSIAARAVPRRVEANALGGRASLSGARKRVARSWLLGVQSAVGLTFLAAASLLGASLWNLWASPVGFQPRGVTTMYLHLPRAEFPSPADCIRLSSSLLQRVRALPGVAGAAIASQAPFQGSATISLAIVAAPGHLSARLLAVSPGYFEALGIPLLRGRAFAHEDAAGVAPVAIVSRSLAHRYLPQGAIGRRLSIRGQRWRVIGEVGDVREAGFSDSAAPTVYLPLSRWGMLDLGVLIVRARPPRAPPVHAIGTLLAEMSSSPSISDAAPLVDTMGDSILQQRLAAGLVGSFAAITLALVLVGTYGTLSEQLAERRAEVGLRMALGARPFSIFLWSSKIGVYPVLVGCIAGLAGAFITGHLLRSLLFGVSWYAPAWIAASLAIVLALAGFASCAPAARAASLDPAAELRRE